MADVCPAHLRSLRFHEGGWQLAPDAHTLANGVGTQHDLTGDIVTTQHIRRAAAALLAFAPVPSPASAPDARGPEDVR